jgi:2'-5' RNA ligase
MAGSSRYAIALVLPGEVEELLDRLRGNFRENMTYISIPHITLAYPFTTETDIALINNELQRVAGNARAFQIVLDGFGYFQGDSNTAYIAIENKQSVVDLHYAINRTLYSLVADGYNREFNLVNFIPHVTIGTGIPDDILNEVKKTLAEVNVHYECEINSFWLLANTGDGKWIIENEFALKE